MIADQTTRNVTGRIHGDVARMSIAEDAMGHIMDLLTNAYSDPEMAVLREYVTNARDSHIAADTARPVEVTLPNAMNPYLRIRDWGVGLSVDDIHAMYSRYGASSKRDTNDQTGMLGIGSKSGLAYADQFTLTCVKDGVKAVVVVTRDEDGGGSMTIPDTSTTDEPNGVEVTIPVTKSHSFDRKADELFRWWEPGTVLVDGEPPARFDGIRMADDVYLTHLDEHYVVMGGVPYPTKYFDEAEIGFGHYASRKLAVFVPVGSVLFSPSREGLRYVSTTKATLDGIVERYPKLAREAVQEQVDAAGSPFDALRIAAEWCDNVPGSPRYGDVTYRGSALPDTIEPPDGISLLVMSNARYSSANGSRMRGVPAPSIPRSVFVSDFAPSKPTNAHRRKLQEWCAERGITADQFVLLPGPVPDSEFIDPARCADWKVVRTIKLDTGNRGGHSSSYLTGRLTGSYDLYRGEERKTEVPAEEVRKYKGHLLYIRGNKYKGKGVAATVRRYLGHDHFTLVCLPENRINKFRRDFPKAQQEGEFRTKAADRWEKSLSDEQRAALALHDRDGSSYYGDSYGHTYKRLRRLDPERIDDPELTAAIRTAMVDVSGLVAQRKALGRRPARPHVPDPLAKYPLFDESMTNHDHTYIYLNAAYAASQENA